MNKLFEILSQFMKYAPYAVAGAKAAEQAIGAGNGDTKKQSVIAGILATVHVGEQVPVPQVQLIATIVDLVVGTLNAAGLFGKTTQSVTVPTQSA